ncbi:MAG: GNAT family N-acetyltransferase [Clostridia bacterium]|nr:GNAT family N-acetyltransferase [Clostridia bacterium]
MEEVRVRGYQEKDQSATRNICVATANGFAVDTQKQKELLCLLFNDYYTENEQDTCFVAANEKDEAVGYIIAARDFQEYKKLFKKYYMPKIYKLSFFQGLIRSIGLAYEGRVSKEYPAHLHIDILDGYQRMGLGHKLMNTLINRLKELGVKGVCLFVGAKNLKGISFYKKFGFTEVKRIAGAVCFGLKLD